MLVINWSSGTANLGGTNANDNPWTNPSLLLAVTDWSTTGFNSFQYAFYICDFLTSVPNFLPFGVKNLFGMFYFAINFNSDITSCITSLLCH